MASNPWEIQPDFVLSRLQLLETLLREVRHRALALHEPVDGDNNWSLGCRIYARSCSALVQAAERWDWLSIVDDGQQFIFKIANVPVRFFHGDSESPSADKLAVAPEEALQLGMCYGDSAVDLIWRLVVETNNAGEVLRIVLIGAHTEGGIDVHFPIPRDDKLTMFAPPRAPTRRGVTMPPPSITVLTPKRAGDTDSNDDSEPNI
jgi:hypothetical protein